MDRMYSIVAKRKLPGQERRRSSFTAERRREEIYKPSVKEVSVYQFDFYYVEEIQGES
uniref:Uncharacterized protein n=1 Tax=Araneus ventricosus TaxID=182803 RepID=A0A4Y2QAI0_ARAVE|nr:hypothetical protein AVEN_237741-1 [Araneus ventricosus]GBN59276.1 hypothetical protein AVEN_243242-1 [Araneus ventricosus]GBN59296.1 hypothetical protein AVEN_62036-1 [Araneus ventricosus]